MPDFIKLIRQYSGIKDDAHLDRAKKVKTGLKKLGQENDFDVIKLTETEKGTNKILGLITNEEKRILDAKKKIEQTPEYTERVKTLSNEYIGIIPKTTLIDPLATLRFLNENKDKFEQVKEIAYSPEATKEAYKNIINTKLQIGIQSQLQKQNVFNETIGTPVTPQLKKEEIREYNLFKEYTDRIANDINSGTEYERLETDIPAVDKLRNLYPLELQKYFDKYKGYAFEKIGQTKYARQIDPALYPKTSVSLGGIVDKEMPMPSAKERANLKTLDVLYGTGKSNNPMYQWLLDNNLITMMTRMAGTIANGTRKTFGGDNYLDNRKKILTDQLLGTVEKQYQKLKEQNTPPATLLENLGKAPLGVAETLMSYVKSIDTIGQYIPTILTGKYMPEDDKYITVTGELNKANKVLSDWLAPEDKKYNLVGDIASGLGSTVGFLALGKLPFFKMKPTAKLMLAGALVNGESAFEETYAQTGDMNKSMQSFVLNAIMGTSEALPIADALTRWQILRKTNGLTKGKLFKSLLENKNKLKIAKDFTKNSALQFVEEGVQEGMQGLYQGLTNKQIWDSPGTYQDLFDEASYQGFVGALSGALFGGFGSVVANISAVKVKDENGKQDIILINNKTATPETKAGIIENVKTNEAIPSENKQKIAELINEIATPTEKTETSKEPKPIVQETVQPTVQVKPPDVTPTGIKEPKSQEIVPEGVSEVKPVEQVKLPEIEGVKPEPVKETKQKVKQPQYSGEKLFPKILKEYKGDEYIDKVSGIKYKYKGEYIPEGKRKSTGYEYEPIYTEEMRKIRNEKLKGKVTEDLTPVEKIIVKEPRDKIPEAISEKVKEKAENLLKEVEDATVEKHGAYYNADLDKSTPAYTINTFPEWFRDLGMNKKNAINALRKIIIDKGQDKGVSVEKVKKIILEHLTQGRVDRDVSMVSGKRTSNKEYFTEAEDKQLSEFLKRFEKDEITIEEFDNAVKEMAKRDESFNAETIKQKKLADEVEKLYNEREELQSEIAKGDAFGKAEKELADVNKKIADIEKQLPEDSSFKFGKNVEEVKPETKKEPKPITYTKYAEAVKEKEKLQKQYEESGNETEIAGIEKRIKELDKQINEYETKQVKKGFISEPEKRKTKKSPEQKYVEEQIKNKNIKPAQKQAEKIKENKRQDKIEKKEAEFKRIKERLRELNDAVTRRSLKARKEKVELLEKYGELKKELGIEEDMFSKKTDMFGEGDISRQQYKQAKDNLGKLPDTLASVSPKWYADRTKDLLVIGRYYVQKGAKSFKEWSIKMINALGEWIKPKLKALWNEINQTEFKTELQKKGIQLAAAGISGTTPKATPKKIITDEQFDKHSEKFEPLTKLVLQEHDIKTFDEFRDTIKTYTGKTDTEFSDKQLHKLFDFVKADIITETNIEEAKKKKRKRPKTMKESGAIPPEILQNLDEEYTPETIKEWQQEAENMIKELGEAECEDIVFNYEKYEKQYPNKPVIVKLADTLAGIYLKRSQEKFKQFQENKDVNAEQEAKRLVQSATNLYNKNIIESTKAGKTLKAFDNMNPQTPLDWLRFAQDIVARGNKKRLESREEIVQALKDAFNGVNEKVWEEVKKEIESNIDKIAKKLAQRIRNEFKAVKDVKLLTQIVQTLYDIFKERNPNIKKPLGNKKNITELIKQLIEMRNEESSAWEEAKEILKKRIKNPEQLQLLEDFFNQEFERPYSDKQLEKLIKYGLDSMGITIQDTVYMHYTKTTELGKTLADKLVEEIGIERKDAEDLVKNIIEKFTKISNARKLRTLQYKIKDKNVLNRSKSFIEKLFELSNTGYVDVNMFIEGVEKVLKLKSMSVGQANKILEMADKIQQHKEGTVERLYYDTQLLNYIKNIQGFSYNEYFWSLSYAQLLSDVWTHYRNIVSTGINTVLNLFILRLHKPRELARIFRSLKEGIRKGAIDFTFVMKYGDIEGKSKYSIKSREKAQILPERATELAKMTDGKVKKALLYYLYFLRHINRFLIASDRFQYHINFEAESRVRAYYIQKREGKAFDKAIERVDKGEDITKALKDELVVYPSMLENALSMVDDKTTLNDLIEIKEKVMATRLSELLVDKAKKNKIAKELEKEIDKLKNPVLFDKVLIDKMNKEMDETILLESDQHSLKTTFNQEPQGLLGGIAKYVTNYISKGQAGAFLQLLIRFVNISANVTNNYLDTSIWGFKHALFGYGFGENRQKVTGLDRDYLLRKATLATIGHATLMYWVMSVFDPDDDNPFFDVTALGPGKTGQMGQVRMTGEKPFSFKIGNTWYTYLDNPFFIPLMTIGYLRDIKKYDKKVTEYDWEIVASLIPTMVHSFMNQTFLMNFLDFTQMLSDPKLTDAQKVGRFAMRNTKSFIPVVGLNINKTLQKIIDPTMYDDGTWRSIFYRELPFVGTLSNAKPMTNIFGEPVKMEFSPIFNEVKNDKEAQMIKFLIKHKALLNKPNTGIDIADYPENISEKDLQKIEDIQKRKLTPDEKYYYVTQSQKNFRIALESAMPMLEKFGDDSEKVRKYVSEIATLSREKAKEDKWGRIVPKDTEERKYLNNWIDLKNAGKRIKITEVRRNINDIYAKYDIKLSLEDKKVYQIGHTIYDNTEFEKDSQYNFEIEEQGKLKINPARVITQLFGRVEKSITKTGKISYAMQPRMIQKIYNKYYEGEIDEETKDKELKKIKNAYNDVLKLFDKENIITNKTHKEMKRILNGEFMIYKKSKNYKYTNEEKRRMYDFMENILKLEKFDMEYIDKTKEKD